MMHDLGDAMRAAYLYGKLDVRVDDARVPGDIHPDEVLIEIAYAGLCGSELHIIEGYELSRPTRSTGAAQIDKSSLGHEYAGVITRVGPGVKSCKVGQRVTVVPRGPCGKCDLCRAGVQALCRRVTQRGGGWANAILAPEQLVYPLPDAVSLQIGAMTEPLSCAVRIIDRTGLRPGTNVCVIGAGPIGLFSAVLAKHAGAAKVIVSEPRASRRAMAKRMGMHIVVNPKEEDLYQTVMDQTNGRGAEVVIESVGLEPALSEAIRMVAIEGTVLWGGLAPTDIRVPIWPNDMFMREYTLRTSWGGVLEFERTIRLEQSIDWSPMTEEVYPLEDVMDAIHFARTEAAGKVLLNMQ